MFMGSGDKKLAEGGCTILKSDLFKGPRFNTRQFFRGDFYLRCASTMGARGSFYPDQRFSHFTHAQSALTMRWPSSSMRMTPPVLNPITQNSRCPIKIVSPILCKVTPQVFYLLHWLNHTFFLGNCQHRSRNTTKIFSIGRRIAGGNRGDKDFTKWLRSRQLLFFLAVKYNSSNTACRENAKM